MKINLDDLCRGDGKLFFHLDVTDIDPDMLVAFHAFTREGREVPVMAFPDDSATAAFPTSDERSFAVALPLVGSDVHFTCLALSPDGSFTQEQTETINAGTVKWLGRMNSVLRRASVEELRNCDKDRTLGRVTFKFWDYLAPMDSDGLLRGTAYVPRCLCEEPPAIAVADDGMEELDVKIVHLPIHEVERASDKTAPLWEVPFSIAFPHDQDLAVFMARDASGAILPGFETLEAWQVRDMCGSVAHVYENAQWDPRYDAWFRQKRANRSVCELQRAEAPAGPAFSIVVPLFRTPLDLFEEMAGSVLAQTYPHWELVLVNASPEDEVLAQAAQDIAAADGRVKVVTLAENGGITLNTNAGVAQATGDFICYFDHDDVLEPDILFEYAKAVAEHPDTDLLYCDEDKLLPDGTYTQPFFKPDFSIDLLRSNNYVCHMLCVRASLLRELPVQTDEFDGAQDHNLTLMVSEHARHIHHVPKILYHWRMTEGSTAASEGNKSYAWDAGQRAVKAHLDRLGIAAEVKPGTLPFTCRVDYAPVGDPLVSIVIPNKDYTDVLDTCLTSIFQKSTYGNFEVVVVENNSEDEATFAYYERAQKAWDKLRVVTWPGQGFNYSEIMNFGVAEARGDYLLLLNNDIEVITPEWIELMLGACQRPEVGAVGAKLYYADDTIQHAGVGITGVIAEHIGLFLDRNDQGYFGLLGMIRNVSSVTGACMMTTRSAFEAVGGLDTNLAIAFNDIDYCLRLQEVGKLIVMNPFVELYHYESTSRGRDDVDQVKNIRLRHETGLFWERWAGSYALGDPYLNPNVDTGIPNARYYVLRW